MLSGREGSEMSRGGLRRDFRITVREDSAPGGRVVRFFNGGPVDLGRIIWGIYCQCLFGFGLEWRGGVGHTADREG